MKLTVVVARALERYAGGQRRVAIAVDAVDRVDGAAVTVEVVLDALMAEFPALRDRVFDEQGAVRRHVNLFVNGESVRFTGGLKTPVDDGAEVAILPAVSGGQ